jgi:hypothetical protein
MALHAKVGILQLGKQHETIQTTGGFFEGVMAVGTVSYIRA